MAGCLNKKKAEFITLGDSDDDIDCIKSKSNYLTKHQPIETNAAQKSKLSAKKTYKTIEQTSDEDETFNECKPIIRFFFNSFLTDLFFSFKTIQSSRYKGVS